MLTTNRKFSKLGLSFAAALLLSSTGGSVAHANAFPTSSDEAHRPESEEPLGTHP